MDAARALEQAIEWAATAVTPSPPRFQSVERHMAHRKHKDKPKPPGYQCNVCEDVVQTWHETFACVGMAEPEGQPSIMHGVSSCRPALPCALFPAKFKQQVRRAAPRRLPLALTRRRRSQCHGITNDITKKMEGDEDEYIKLYNELMARRNPYIVCEDRQMCPMQTSEAGKRAYAALLHPECYDDPNCEASSEVPGTCLACFHVVKSLPLFREVCAPADGDRTPKAKVEGREWVTDAEVKDDTTEGEVGDKDKLLLLLQTSSTEPGELLDAEGIGSPPLSQRDTTSGGGLKDCMALWNEFAVSPMARTLISYPAETGPYPWDANTVCKCLHKCSYTAADADRVLSACQYEPNALRDELLFPDLVAFKAADKKHAK